MWFTLFSSSCVGADGGTELGLAGFGHRPAILFSSRSLRHSRLTVAKVRRHSSGAGSTSLCPGKPDCTCSFSIELYRSLHKRSQHVH